MVQRCRQDAKYAFIFTKVKFSLAVQIGKIFYAKGLKMEFKSEIMNEEAVYRALRRISHEIVERCGGVDNLVLVGIKSRGIPLAEKLKQLIFAFESVDVPLGQLDISLYRDDLTEIADLPTVKKTDIGVDVKGKTVVLVDDVLFTGRTVRAAIDAVFDQGARKPFSWPFWWTGDTESFR